MKKPDKCTRKELAEKIISRIKLMGVDNINVSEVCRETGYHYSTVNRYIKEILTHVPKEKLAVEVGKAYFDFIGMDSRVAKIINDSSMSMDTDTQLKAIDLRSKLWERKSKVWESFGLKDVVQEDMIVQLKIIKPEENLSTQK